MSPDDRALDPPPPPSEEELRAELLRFARKILRLEEEGRLLSSPADLQTVLGELRRRLFEWEVRRAAELGIMESRSRGSDSDQIVREAREAEEQLRRDLDAADDPDGPQGGEGPLES
ncbi:MAG: hypothetical protein EA350_01125 [Gemmatimonadales bacterium]|nr:MAG: hypothetical protein EA350_01125 [Gemmatimonadales bacterium]